MVLMVLMVVLTQHRSLLGLAILRLSIVGSATLACCIH
jgi:hypothetical protein